jgi:hypothetical protein
MPYSTSVSTHIVTCQKCKRTKAYREAVARGGLWKFYGRECFDVMYSWLLKPLPDGKRIWFSQAVEWLSKNTQDT